MWSRISSPTAVIKALLFVLLLVLLPGLSSARSRAAYTDIGFDFPVDGGGLLMASRMVELTDWFHVGVVGGGGVIHKNFDITGTGVSGLHGETDSTVFPFIAPQIGVYGSFIGISLAYGAYYAKTTFDVHGLSTPLSSHSSGWNGGFYSPLLNLDFYLKNLDMVAGFGLGGFFGTGGKTLVAENSTVRVTTDENPLSTLTFHVHVRWADGRKERQKNSDEL